MKKLAKQSESRFHVLCPFCNFAVDRTAAIQFCGGCYTEFYRNKDEEIVFDSKRKSDKYIWAKALMKAGGMKIGNFQV